MMPVRLEITKSMLSESQKRQWNKSEDFKEVRLCTPFGPRTKYVVHAKTLQRYLQLGAVITKVHRIMSFTQGPIAAGYIELCTMMRKQATNSYESNIYKLMVCI